jgi:hypothetical protein
MDASERDILRDLALQVAVIAADAEMDLRRNLWRRHNSLEKTPTLVYIFAYPGDVGDAECIHRNTLRCRDPYCRELEFDLRLQAFRASMEDDQVIEPWLTIRPVYRNTGFGADPLVEHAAGSRSIHYLPALQRNGDLGRLTLPSHALDEDASRQRWDIADEAFGDILTVDRKRSPYCTMNALGGDLGILLGFDRLLYDMVDRPDRVHELIRTLCTGYTKVFDEALAAGDYSLTSGDSQTMCYAKEHLRHPPFQPVGVHVQPGNGGSVPRDDRRVLVPLRLSHDGTVRADGLRLLRGPHAQDRPPQKSEEPPAHRGDPMGGHRAMRGADRDGLRSLVAPEPGQPRERRLGPRVHPPGDPGRDGESQRLPCGHHAEGRADRPRRDLAPEGMGADRQGRLRGI